MYILCVNQFKPMPRTHEVYEFNLIVVQWIHRLQLGRSLKHLILSKYFHSFSLFDFIYKIEHVHSIYIKGKE